MQEAIEGRGCYRGKEGHALASVEERLGHKERLLREEKAWLREEKLVLSRFLYAVPEQRRVSEGDAILPRTSKVGFRQIDLIFFSSPAGARFQSF